MHLCEYRKYIENGKGIVECMIKFDTNEKRAYFTCDPKYLEYCQDNYDGFLVLLFLVAMHKKKNITIEGSVSYKLYFNLVNYIMPIIKYILPEYHMIKISCDSFDDRKYNNHGVACGLSCGVDSLSCLNDHYFKECGNLKLTHVTSFYLGACRTREIYENRIQNVKEYLSHTNLQFMEIDTNFTEINYLEHHFFHTFKNLCMPLFFQKLFRHYFYGSCFTYFDSKIMKGSKSITSTEPMLIHMLSTENTFISLHGSQYSRVLKTYLISNHQLAQKYLDVCLSSFDYTDRNNQKINCSYCEKCMRTQFTLEYLNKLEDFQDVFYLDRYFERKEKYLSELNINSPYDRELKKLLNNDTNDIDQYCLNNNIKVPSYKKNIQEIHTIEEANITLREPKKIEPHLISFPLPKPPLEAGSTWYAFKKHWKLEGKRIRANQNTVIKKTINLHSSEIQNSNLKKDIPNNQTLMLIKDDPSSLYYEVNY
jgi:hypothetical protein